jgi:hypothetical protein
MQIRLCREPGVSSAVIDGELKKFEGRSDAEAIGIMIISFPEKFGIDIVYSTPKKGAKNERANNRSLPGL